MSFPSTLVNKRPETTNPFESISNFTCLQEVLKTEGKQLPAVINTVAEHMVRNEIPSATVICSGTLGKSKRYFVNLDVMKKTSPDQFADVSNMHSSVHLEAPGFKQIVVLKVGTVKARQN